MDTLLTLPPEGAEPNTLLPPVPLWDITAGGDLVVGSSASSSVERRRGATGEVVWISRHRETPPPLSDQGRSHLEDVLVASVEQRSGAAVPREARAQLLAQMTFPERSPVLADLRIAPDGRIWVRRARPVEDMDREALRVGSAAGFGGEHWEILNADGRLEARVRMPRRFVPRAFHGSWLYGILTDELGVQHPARVGSGVLGP